MTLIQTIQERLAKIAKGAKLPAHYQWGSDAMEQFNFGKERAGQAIDDADLSDLEPKGVESATKPNELIERLRNEAKEVRSILSEESSANLPYAFVAGITIIACLEEEAADTIAALTARLEAAEAELKKFDPDPVVCGCHEAGCPHTPIAKLPRQVLADHFKGRIKMLDERLEAKEAECEALRRRMLHMATTNSDERAISG